MKRVTQVLVAMGVALLCAGTAMADGPVPEEVERTPDAAIAAAVANIVFMPLRFGVTAVGGFLGGFTGLMTAGNYDAANDVWHLFQGQNILTPEIMRGKEALRFGEFEFRPGAEE